MPQQRRRRTLAYYRVSTTRQAQTGTDAEEYGDSIATQKEACHRYADQHGLEIIEEYPEPGGSGTAIDRRPQFQKLLERVYHQGDVDVVLVYARSRAFRNAYEAMVTRENFRKHGVELVSTQEPSEPSLEGDLVTLILDGVNEYQSRKLGADVSFKMAAKAARGGTPGRAKLGYLNVRKKIDGRNTATIEVDTERGPFIVTAFELFATGQYSLRKLRDALFEAGLRNRPAKANPAGTPVSVSQLEKVLRDRYYLGYVTWRGEEHQGRHPRLIDPELSDRVQAVLAERHRGTRQHKWDHYLKGGLWCHRCSGRIILEPARSHTGRVHFYLRCIGLQHRTCDLPRFPLAKVEKAVEAHYATLTIDPAERDELEGHLTAAIGARQSTTKALRQRLRTELARLGSLEDQYLDLLGQPDWPAEKLTARLREVNLERDKIKQRLDEATTVDLETAKRRITALLDLLARPRELFKTLPDDLRRTLGALCFDKLYIDADNLDTPRVVRDQPASHTAPLRKHLRESKTCRYKLEKNEEPRPPVKGDQGSNKPSMVGLTVCWFRT